MNPWQRSTGETKASDSGRGLKTCGSPATRGRGCGDGAASAEVEAKVAWQAGDSRARLLEADGQPSQLATKANCGGG